MFGPMFTATSFWKFLLLPILALELSYFKIFPNLVGKQ